MTEHNEAGVEFSSLSRLFSQGDLSVEVTIHRLAGSDGGWTLEVIGDNEHSVVWDEPFATDREAYDEFQVLVAEKGLAEVMNPPDDDADGQDHG